MSVKVKIDGVGIVEFDDSFKNLSTAQKQRLINEVASEREAIETKNKSKPAEDEDYNVSGLLRTAIGQGAALGFGDEMEAACAPALVCSVTMAQPAMPSVPTSKTLPKKTR